MPKSSPVLALAALLFCLHAGCANAPAQAGKTPPNPPPSETKSSRIPKLETGMTAELILQKLGKPDEIKPMESRDGKAEVWIYHIESVVGSAQVTTGFREIPVFAMNGGTPVTINVKEPIYTLANKVSVVTLTLLMFNGKLTAQKSSVETRLAY